MIPPYQIKEPNINLIRFQYLKVKSATFLDSILYNTIKVELKICIHEWYIKVGQTQIWGGGGWG